jgi:hypothetical protein
MSEVATTGYAGWALVEKMGFLQTIRKTKNTSLAFVFFLCVPSVCHAGDEYEGFKKFAGKWKVASCSPGGRDTLPGLSISLTETRLNAVNVYFLDPKGQNSKLHFTTASILRTEGHITKDSTNKAKLTGNQSSETGIRVALRDAYSEVKIEIIKSAPDRLTYKRQGKAGVMSCNLESYK